MVICGMVIFLNVSRRPPTVYSNVATAPSSAMWTMLRQARPVPPRRRSHVSAQTAVKVHRGGQVTHRPLVARMTNPGEKEEVPRWSGAATHPAATATGTHDDVAAFPFELEHLAARVDEMGLGTLMLRRGIAVAGTHQIREHKHAATRIDVQRIDQRHAPLRHPGTRTMTAATSQPPGALHNQVTGAPMVRTCQPMRRQHLAILVDVHPCHLLLPPLVPDHRDPYRQQKQGQAAQDQRHYPFVRHRGASKSPSGSRP